MRVHPWQAARQSHSIGEQGVPGDQPYGALDDGGTLAAPYRGSRDDLNSMAPLPSPDSYWSQPLEQQARESICLTKQWLDLITMVYGYQVFSLTTTGTDGQITGFLPLCSILSPLGGKRLVALPFSDYCPLLATDTASANSLVDQAVALTRAEKARCLELRTGPSSVLANRRDLVEAPLYVRWLTPLAPKTDTVWSALKAPVQRQIKKARKLGVRVRVAEHREDMRTYYQLHLQTRCRKHGMPAQPLRYFNGLWDHFAETGTLRLLLAEAEGQVVAGMVLMCAGETMHYAYGASDERYLHLSPNNLLMWEAMTLGCTQGYTQFDLGRTATENAGLMGFKRGWGGEALPLPYYYYPQPAGLAATSESSRKFKVLTACWRRLPLPVAASLGGHLYKYLG
jgi:FemAB-related protein (PEP-CTERM system-associated)